MRPTANYDRGERAMSYHRLCGKNPLGAIMLALAISFVTPAFSATLPTDNEQEILVKTTLGVGRTPRL
jgi:hypothetical protein